MTFKEEAYIEVFPRQTKKPVIKHESMIEETEEVKETGEVKEVETDEAPKESMLESEETNEVGEENNDI